MPLKKQQNKPHMDQKSRAQMWFEWTLGITLMLQKISRHCRPKKLNLVIVKIKNFFLSHLKRFIWTLLDMKKTPQKDKLVWSWSRSSLDQILRCFCVAATLQYLVEASGDWTPDITAISFIKWNNTHQAMFHKIPFFNIQK